MIHTVVGYNEHYQLGKLPWVVINVAVIYLAYLFSSINITCLGMGDATNYHYIGNESLQTLYFQCIT